MADKKNLRSVDFDTKPFDGTNSAKIKEAIEVGNILVELSTVENRTAGIEIPYPSLTAVNQDGLEALFGGQIELTYFTEGDRKGKPRRSDSVAGVASYGADLIVRSKIRAAWEKANLAPEKEWDKDVANLAKALKINEEEAEAMMLAKGRVKPVAAPPEDEPEAEETATPATE